MPANISVLVDWRILNNVVYLGPIVGIGYPTAKVDFNSNRRRARPTKSSPLASPVTQPASEAGVKLGLFLIGAETGYSSMKLDKHSTDNSNLQTKVDLSGFYGKLMVGCRCSDS